MELLNDDAFIRYIGDKGVRNVADAREYLRNGPIGSYEKYGFGLYLVCRRADKLRIGMCGLVRRDGLDDPDVGFAFLPEYRMNGYAFESTAAVIDHARRNLGIKRLLGICNPENHGSIRLLEKAGFVFERRTRLSPEADEVNLYASQA
ncbi:MAG: GNAT family N-acetyltransferase [Gammaproteobacteria bacterium]|nr:GNAT family N-acetyltransferase [Gammaproteobacteria bacterium]